MRLQATKIWTGAFFLVAFLELLFVGLDSTMGQTLVKPLIIPVLIGYAISSGVLSTSRPKYLVLIALAFAWAGDVLLMFQEISEIYFLSGLGSFLIMHILYTLVLSKTRFSTAWPPQKELLIFLIAALTVTTAVFGLIDQNLGPMRGPVILYTLAILAMAFMALARKGVTSVSSYRLTFIGAILFVLSDSILAINKFGPEVPLSGLIIMATYMMSQFLILKGLSLHPRP